MERYHVTLGDKRTTVTLHDTLAGVLAIKLRQTPGTGEAHSAVRTWLQEQLDENNDPGRAYVSRWLQQEALLFIADKKISKAYLDWYLAEYDG